MRLLNCRHVSSLLSQEQDKSCTPTRPWALRIHLLMCGSCRRYAQQLGWLRQTMQKIPAEENVGALTLPARERIRARLKQNGPDRN